MRSNIWELLLSRRLLLKEGCENLRSWHPQVIFCTLKLQKCCSDLVLLKLSLHQSHLEGLLEP